jgi:DNA-binding transcriptional ArsR family regulator
MNMLAVTHSSEISQLFKIMGDPFRVQLLLALADKEACVCHLECLLGKRQAFISQHLMSLRMAGILTARREGKYIFYSLKDREVLSLIRRAAEIAGLTKVEMKSKITIGKLSRCECPQCGNAKPITINP